MKKFVLLFLTSLLLISLLFPFGTKDATELQIVQQEQQGQVLSSKIRYYYNLDDISTMTTESQEFEKYVSKNDEIFVVFELNNKPTFLGERLKIGSNASHEETRAIRRAYYDKVLTYYAELNKKFVEDNGFRTSSNEYIITMSRYSPFVQIAFKTYEDYIKYGEKIIAMSHGDDIAGIDIGVDILTEPTATRVSSDTERSGSISEMLDIMNVINSEYDGAGTKVGVIEAYGVAFSTSHPELASLQITTHPNGARQNDHAVNVVRMLCGSEGVAPNVDSVYISRSQNSTDLIESIEWLLDNDVDVINMCKSNLSLSGQYVWASALIDYYVRFLYMPFICSAGNSGDAGISHYGLAYNAITVANSTMDNNINETSSFGMDSGINNRKPTVSAPGTNIILDTGPEYENGVKTSSGTSYSTPFVAGIVARLISEFPALRTCPDTIAAALIVSAEPVNGQLIGYSDIHAGAGVVNYEKAREAVLHSSGFACHIDFTNGNTIKSTTAVFPTGKRIKVVACWLTNSTVQTETDVVLLNTHTNYNLQVINYDGGVTNAATPMNYEYISFYNLRSDAWTINLIKAGENYTDYCDWGTVTWVSE